MANLDYLAKLREGATVWNDWRRNELGIFYINLSQANLAGENLFDINLRDADLGYTDLAKTNLDRANLRDANLQSTDLTQASLRWAELVAADLRKANLRGTNFTGANLREARLSSVDLFGADLLGANFYGADLSRANLSRANLKRANLTGANLSGANLKRASLDETVFGNTDLSVVKALESCFHHGPSILDFRTLVRSGNIPLVFLQGCGLPNQLIDYLPSLLNQPIQFHSCFISYSTKDEEFAQRLHADLQHKGVRCWFAPHDIQSGKKLHQQIDEAIQIHDRLLLILSEHSMDSEWVKTEIAHARQKELKDGRQVLFPLGLVSFSTIQKWKCFDADTGKDSAREIREYFIPDFSNWKDHDSYQKAFPRLLTDLKA